MTTLNINCAVGTQELKSTHKCGWEVGRKSGTRVFVDQSALNSRENKTDVACPELSSQAAGLTHGSNAQGSSQPAASIFCVPPYHRVNIMPVTVHLLLATLRGLCLFSLYPAYTGCKFLYQCKKQSTAECFLPCTSG